MNGNTPFGQKLTGLPSFGSTGSPFNSPQQPIIGQSSIPFGQSNPGSILPQTNTQGQNANPVGFPTPTSQSTFGNPQTQTMFGTPTNPSAFGAPSGQPTFGAPSTQPTFGAPSAQPTFGAPSAQPTFGGPSAQPTFGTPSAQPTFGTPSAQPTFGTPTTTPAFGATSTTPAFGATSTTPAFGSNTATPTFGAPTTTPAFGTQTTSAFGTPTTAATFGTTKPLTLGTTNQQPATLPTFGATTTATTQSSGFQFGTTPGQSGFGTTTTATTLGLGTTPTTTNQSSLTFAPPQTTSSLFGGSKPGTLSFSTPATTQSSLTFGASVTTKPTTTQVTTSFSFGTLGSTTPATATTTSTTNITNGLSNFSTTGPSLGSVIGGKSMLTITGNTATPLYSTKAADLQAGRNAGQIPPKCQNVHPSVMELVESFKNHMKEQKHLCLEVSRASLKPISKISDDAENIKRSVMMLERAVNKNNLMNSKLKEETVKALADVEVAQKAMDIPGGFPSDNSIITDYFLQLANKFQQQVLALRVELESTEKSILCELNPVAFTPQELSTTMQRLYECFVALAGRFQFVHAQISNLKVQHLELRRKKMEDYTDIFSKKVIGNTKPSIQGTQAGGPSPFSGVRSINSVMSSLGYPASDMTSTSFSAKPLNTSVFGNSLNQSLQSNNLLTSLPQQSAPGSKRGKR